MKRKALPFICLLLLIPSVTAAGTFTEDFENDTVGQNPTESWYTYTEYSSCSPCVVGEHGSSVVSGGLDGTSQAYLFNPSTTTNAAKFDFTPAQHTIIEYWVDPTPGGGTDNTWIHLCGDGGFHSYSGGCNSVSDVDEIYEIQGEDSMSVQHSSGPLLLFNDGLPHKITVELDWGAKTATFKVDDSTVGAKPFSDTSVSTASSLNFRRAFANPANLKIDQLCVTDTNCVGAVTPAAPTGVSGSVTNNEVNPDEYLVKFRLSPDDTNQDTGAYTYELYYDTGSGATLYDTYPPGVAVNGVIADQPMVSTTGNIDWYAVALEPLLSLPSANSCTITLDSTTLGDSATCGTPIPGEEETGADLTGPQGGLFGGDKAGLAAALQISEAALEIVIGLMLLMLLIAGGWFAYGIVGAAGLGTIGLILNYALGLFPFWTIYVIGFIGTAIAILLVKVMRR